MRHVNSGTFKVNANSSNSPLTAVCPLDGRYKDEVAPLQKIFSEFGLIRLRVLVEIEWLSALINSSEIPELEQQPPIVLDKLRLIADDFTEADAQVVKNIEADIRHDVKAVEYFVKNRIKQIEELKQVREFVHFGATSYDINDNCFALMLKDARQQVIMPELTNLIGQLDALAIKYAGTPMLSRTHGQPASTTTVGKEFRIFADRLQRQLETIDKVRIFGKFTGAVGNHNALTAAYPSIDWSEFTRLFVEKTLGLENSPITTQTESHDYIGEYCHAVQRINSVMIDLCRDMWGYISLGYFGQKTSDIEVGSSTMPHKVNPIDFENAEGNLGLANANLLHLAEKLPISRWQRDLSDSTVLRNLGTGIGYSLIAYRAVMRGLSKLEVNSHRLNEDLNNAWEIISEAIQTVMRKHGAEVPYEKLKQLTRGVHVSQSVMSEFIHGLELPREDKERLIALTPHTYIGHAARLARGDH